MNLIMMQNNIELLGLLGQSFDVEHLEDYQSLVFILYNILFEEDATLHDKCEIYYLLRNILQQIDYYQTIKMNQPEEYSIDDMYDYLVPSRIQNHTLLRGPKSRRCY